MDESLFKNDIVQSNRVLYTASDLAKIALFYLQEAGSLTALREHTSSRQKLNSYLFFLVVDGSGKLNYGGEIFHLSAGDCVFIDCSKKYSHETDSIELWTLKWVHFNGATMPLLYEEYMQIGGLPAFSAAQPEIYSEHIDKILKIVQSAGNLRDYSINRELSGLLSDLMNEKQKTYKPEQGSIQLKLQEIRSYVDEHFAEKILLEDLSIRFNINKFYLTRVFKSCFGISVINFLTEKRVTHAKYLLRFTNRTIEDIGISCGLDDPSYFNRVFRKIEGINPSEFRRLWSINR